MWSTFALFGLLCSYFFFHSEVQRIKYLKKNVMKYVSEKIVMCLCPPPPSVLLRYSPKPYFNFNFKEHNIIFASSYLMRRDTVLGIAGK